MTGMVTNIQRYSVNDGYGIRTIVFLAGCSMHCAWCQNPETLGLGKPKVMFNQEACSGCGACTESCPYGAIAATEAGYTFDRSRCTSCFACVAECYFGARKPSAQTMTADKAFVEVMKDEAFYRNSGGGLTISGGEPLLQPQFCRTLLERVRGASIHTAVETAGNVPRMALDMVMEHVSLFLYDVKAITEETHRKATGVSNRAVLDNLAWLATTGVEIMVRVPLIPGVNDGKEFNAIVEWVVEHPTLNELHILPYHSIGSSKYSQLGLDYPSEGTPEDNTAEVERCARYAQRRGLRVSIGGAGFAKRLALAPAIPAHHCEAIS